MRSRGMMSEHLFDPAPYTRTRSWRDPSNPCVDCGVATTPRPLKPGKWEWYVVHGPVWQTAGADPRNLLCIGCLEGRLDRRLVPQDFPALGINDPSPLDSPRLRARRGV
jgi:hypothetical protein